MSPAIPERQTATLYDKIGGKPAIAAMVDAFYQRVLADPQLAPFFQGVALEKLLRMQQELFAAALGGPVSYTGRPLAHAHSRFRIGLADYQRFIHHLFETLRQYQLSDQDCYDIVGRLNLYTEDVVSAGTGLVG